MTNVTRMGHTFEEELSFVSSKLQGNNVTAYNRNKIVIHWCFSNYVLNPNSTDSLEPTTERAYNAMESDYMYKFGQRFASASNDWFWVCSLIAEKDGASF